MLKRHFLDKEIRLYNFKNVQLLQLLNELNKFQIQFPYEQYANMDAS